MKSSVEQNNRTAPIASKAQTTPESPAKKQSDLVLSAKVILIAATFFAAVWAIDLLVNP